MPGVNTHHINIRSSNPWLEFYNSKVILSEKNNSTEDKGREDKPQYHISAKDTTFPIKNFISEKLSYIQIFSHEQEHLADKRQAARERGNKIIQENITFITQLGRPGYYPVAVGAQARSKQIDPENGKQAESVDHISSWHNSRADAASFLEPERGLGPKIMVLDDYLSLAKVPRVINELLQLNSPKDIEIIRRYDPKVIKVALSALENISRRIANLRSKLSDLNKVFSPTNSLPFTTDHPGLEVTINNINSEIPASFSINIKQFALPNIVSSDEVTDTTAELGLEGALIINGEKITVESDDSLYSIMRKINVGEDTNQDGILSITEDINQNSQIDGGQERTKVKAEIVDNKLYLTKQEEIAFPTVIGEEGGVGEELGFLVADSEGNYELKNIIQVGQPAIINYNNQDYTSANNEFENILSDITITLRPEFLYDEQGEAMVSEAEPLLVTASLNPENKELYNTLQSFTQAYNQALGALNNATFYPGSASEDHQLFKLRARIIAAVEKEIDFTNQSQMTINKAEDIGINIYHQERAGINELTLDSLLHQIKTGLMLLEPQAIENKDTGHFIPSIIQQLKQIGIVQKEDGQIEITTSTLLKALDENSLEVRRLFLDKKGIIQRLEEVLQWALDENTGVLAIKEHVLEAKQNQDPEKLGLTLDKETSLLIKASSLSALSSALNYQQQQIFNTNNNL